MEADELFTRVGAAQRCAANQRCAINRIAALRTDEGGVLGRSVVGWDEQRPGRFLLAAAAELIIGAPDERRGPCGRAADERGGGALGCAFSGIASVGAAEGCWCFFVGNSILFLCDASTILLVDASVILVDISSRRETTDCLRA